MENDIKNLKHSISIHQTHLQKTELWCDNIGKWATSVIGARKSEFTNTDMQMSSNTNPNENILLFEIHVQLHDIVETNKENFEYSKLENSSFKEGWIIYRTIKQFESLNESLSELITEELEKKFKKAQSFLKRNYLSKNKTEENVKQATLILDEYIKVISEDSSLAQSDALYTFLCPSLDYFTNKTKQLEANGDESFSLRKFFQRLYFKV